MSQDAVLTTKHVAAIPKLAEKTVYSMAQAWRVRRKDFDDWVGRQARGRTGKGAPSKP